MIDTARLWIPTILLFIPNAFFLYIAIPIFPPTLIIFIGYGIVLYSFRKEAQYTLFILPLIVSHGFLILFTSLNSSIVWIPFVLFAIIMLINLIQVRKELNIFERTVLSLNDTDRTKARKALRSKDLDDIAEVAKYSEWSSL